MIRTYIEKNLEMQIYQLNPLQKRKLFEFINTFNTPVKPDKSKTLQFIGSISNEDLNLIKYHIEEDCERVDLNEW